MKSIVLLSGGLDSSTVLAMRRAEGVECHALSFRYGQRHVVELSAAARVAAALGAASHSVVTVDAAVLAGSALTGRGEVPKDRTTSEIGTGIPVTYVPARNTLFVAHALGLAETLGADEIALGINALDYSGYPDCRPAWLEAMQCVADVGTRAGVEGRGVLMVAPLINMTKAEIVATAIALKVPLELTHSCYAPNGRGHACGRCDSCRIRAGGFAEVGVIDPKRSQLKGKTA